MDAGERRKLMYLSSLSSLMKPPTDKTHTEIQYIAHIYFLYIHRHMDIPKSILDI